MADTKVILYSFEGNDPLAMFRSSCSMTLDVYEVQAFGTLGVGKSHRLLTPVLDVSFRDQIRVRVMGFVLGTNAWGIWYEIIRFKY